MNIGIEWLAAYLALGAFVGFFAGLLGVGGGAIMVPMLTTLFAAQGFPREHMVHLALGTSMAGIVITSISSLRAHHAHGAVRWDIVRGIAPGVLAGTFAGTFVASRAPTQPLLSLTAIEFQAASFMQCANVVRTMPTSSPPDRNRLLDQLFDRLRIVFRRAEVPAFRPLGGILD